MPDIKILLKLTGPEAPVEQITVGPQGLRIGRTRDNNLALEHREISRQHLRIIWREDKYFVEDLNSSNGVWLNDQRLIPREPVELQAGDVIRVGPFLLTVLRFILPEAAPPPLPELPPPPSASMLPIPTPVPDWKNGEREAYPAGVPMDRSSWLQYLPAIYSDDEFIGRYLLIFESMLSPIVWMIDNFDLYLSPEVAPREWLRWMASWFDILLLPELPTERQRMIMNQLGWLFLRRGTRAGLERLLELYFGVTPEIIEDADQPCHFTVRLPLSQGTSKLGRDIADRLIASQKPAFAAYTLEVT